MGIAGGSIGLSSLMQDEAASGATKSASGPSDLITVLGNLQRAREAGLISQEEFEAAKAKALGLSLLGKWQRDRKAT